MPSPIGAKVAAKDGTSTATGCQWFRSAIDKPVSVEVTGNCFQKKKGETEMKDYLEDLEWYRTGVGIEWTH